MKMNIFPPIFLLVAALWLSASNLDYMVLGKDSIENMPSICTQQPCHPLPPPSGYPSYGAPAPPRPPSFSGYPSYGAPPPPSLPGYPSYGAAPPPPPRQVQANCPPAAPVQCCQQYPTNSNPYPYQPLVDDHSPNLDIPLFTTSIVTLLFSFVVLF